VRSAVSGSDIARMASSTIAAKPAIPPSPDAREREQDATLAARDAKGLRTSPRRLQRPKDPVVPSQLIAESQNLLSSPESKDEQFTVAAVEVNVESQLTLTTDFPGDKSMSGPPPPANNCAWSQHLQQPCPSKPAPVKCSKPNCKQMIHHLCMIAWETSQGHDGPLRTVCPTHHDYFNAIGGGGKVGQSLPRLPPLAVRDDVSFSDMVDFDDGEDFGISEFTTDQFDVNERCSYFMERVPISNDNRAAVEAVYVLEAYTLVKSQNTLRKPEINAKMLETYKGLIEAIPGSRCADFAVKSTMLKGYYKAKTASAKGMGGRVDLVRKLVQGIIRELKLNKLPSCCGIFDVKDRWLRANYAEVTGGHDSEMPDGWWLSNERLGKAEKDDTRVPCIYLLAALVHKNNPDVIEDPTLAAAGGTHEQQRDQVAKDRGKEIVASKVASVTVRGELDESMMRTKATLMEQNIELQATEGIEKQLNLMDKFKSSFVNVYGENDASSGQREYDMAVCDLLHELPFMKKLMKKRKAAENEK
jgi:hypothetical protein